MVEVLERVAEAESQLDASVHPVLRRIYATRGVFREGELRLDLADLLPPGLLKNSDNAASILADAVAADKNILVVGDFDADGATSCALFKLGLRAMGYNHVDYLVPNRFEYGYGLTPEIVAVAQERQPDLIVTVDNGIASIDGVAAANAADIDVLVTDHHLPGNVLPDACCILNPNLPNCDFPSKALAGVGVVFYLLSALRAELRDRDWFSTRNLSEPNLAQFLDLVALGTVADVVPLDQNNRRLVRHGIHIIRSGKGRPGILALLGVAGRNSKTVVANDLAFAAGPRLNAAGRLDDMSLGIACLLEENPSRAHEMAVELDGLNRDRRQIEQDMQEQAVAVLAGLNIHASDQLGICLYDASWHQGVIGILASRIKEKFHRPCIVFADTGEDQGGSRVIKGSARSIEGLHIRDALDALATRHPHLLQKFGGHAMAAGLAIRQDDFTAFGRAFEEVLSKELDRESLLQTTWVDGELSPDCFSLAFASELREAGPWGQHFPEPLFQGEFAVINSRVIGEKHLKLTLQVPEEGPLIDAIAFNVDERILHRKLVHIALAYRLDVNEFRGNVNPQLVVEQVLDYTAN
jgi:single-stranded-DNA-specific exonuclease